MIYLLIRFLHVVGILGMSATLAIEATGLIGMRNATGVDEVRAWVRTRRWVLRVGPASLATVLASGVYMTVASYGWAGWVVTSIGSVVALAAIGGTLTGIPMARIEAQLAGVSGALSGSLQTALRARVLSISLVTRMSLTVGVVFLMVTKPDPMACLAVIAAAIATGLLMGSLLGAGEPASRVTS